LNQGLNVMFIGSGLLRSKQSTRRPPVLQSLQEPCQSFPANRI
jgi:hypothetical protein